MLWHMFRNQIVFSERGTSRIFSYGRADRISCKTSRLWRVPVSPALSDYLHFMHRIRKDDLPSILIGLCAKSCMKIDQYASTTDYIDGALAYSAQDG